MQIEWLALVKNSFCTTVLSRSVRKNKRQFSQLSAGVAELCMRRAVRTHAVTLHYPTHRSLDTGRWTLFHAPAIHHVHIPTLVIAKSKNNLQPSQSLQQ